MYWEALLIFFIGFALGAAVARAILHGVPIYGKIFVTEDEGGPTTFTLEVNGQPEQIAEHDRITFLVEKVS